MPLAGFPSASPAFRLHGRKTKEPQDLYILPTLCIGCHGVMVAFGIPGDPGQMHDLSACLHIV
jgi:hypothetical protein